jgi:RNA polymerase sigma-70 factor (ECF subfamily)
MKRETFGPLGRPGKRPKGKMTDSSDDPISPEDRLLAGDPAAAAELFAAYRDRLKRMIRLRLDRRLQGRLDASDVLQEAFLDVQRKASHFAARPDMPTYLWLRLLTAERLLILHRHHLGTQMRNAAQEVSLCHRGSPAASTHSLANLLLGRLTSPTQAAIRAERQARLQEALDGMDTLDREVLALRHFEELSNGEVSTVLGLSKTAASNRYIRALRRLKEILSTLPGIDPNAPAG